MAIHQTGAYRVKSSAVEKVKLAIRDFVNYVEASEPGTRMYSAWQKTDEPTQFLHLFRFEDAAAQARHGESDAVKRFESVYSPELLDGDVVFTDYEQVASKRPSAAAILGQFYAAVVQRDLATARRYLHDDLLFIGLFETYHGADEYIAALTGLLQVTVRLEVKQIMAEDDHAAVFFELETKAPAEATVLVAEWHEFRDGKIARVRSAFDGRPYEAMFTTKPTPRDAQAA